MGKLQMRPNLGVAMRAAKSRVTNWRNDLIYKKVVTTTKHPDSTRNTETKDTLFLLSRKEKNLVR